MSVEKYHADIRYATVVRAILIRYDLMSCCVYVNLYLDTAVFCAINDDFRIVAACLYFVSAMFNFELIIKYLGGADKLLPEINTS